MLNVRMILLVGILGVMVSCGSESSSNLKLYEKKFIGTWESEMGFGLIFNEDKTLYRTFPKGKIDSTGKFASKFNEDGTDHLEIMTCDDKGVANLFLDATYKIENDTLFLPFTYRSTETGKIINDKFGLKLIKKK